MEITSPQHVGYYVDRDYDCRKALRPVVAEMIRKQHQAFLDLNQIIDQVSEQAEVAGWTHRDVQAAVTALVHEGGDTSSPVSKIPPADEPSS